MAVQLGRTVRSLAHLDGPVQVRFDDGRRGEYDLVVGADGLHSAVRRLAVDHDPGPGRPAQLAVPGPCPPQLRTGTVMLGQGASFLTVPVGQGLVDGYADVTADRAPVGEADADPIGGRGQRFAGFAAPVPALLGHLQDPNRVHVAPIEQVAAEGWGRGRWS